MVKNFAASTVAAGPSPATSGTSITVASGTGARFYAGRASVYPLGAVPTPDNAEVIDIVSINGDVLTVTRGAESSTPRAIAPTDVITQGVTAGMWDDLAAGPAYVRFTTTGATFAPVVEAAAGAVVSWTVEETGEVQTGVTPSFSWGSALTRHVRLTARTPAGLNALDHLRTINLGFDHTNDAGHYVMGAQYDKAAELVTGVEGLHHCTGLVRFAAANIVGLVGTLSFRGLADLEYVEVAYSRVQAVDLTGCTSLIRLCLEQNNLSYLDLNPVAGTLRDLRGANQHGGTLTFAELAAPMAQLYHLCVRDQTVVNIPDPETRLPVVEELWCWNTGQTGALDVVSTSLTSLQAYGNSLTSVTITGGGHPGSIDLSDNPLTTEVVDALLVAVEAWGTSSGSINLGSTADRTSASDAAVTALEGRSWTVTATGGGGGGGGTALWSDDFERPDAVGFAAVGNGWAAAVGGAVSIVSGDLVRTDSGGYGAIYNPAGGALPADYRVDAVFAGAAIPGGYLGVWARRGSDNRGVCAFLNASGTDLRIMDGSGYLAGAVTVTADNAFPAGWTDTGVDHTLSLRVTGSLAEVYADDVLVGHGTIAVHVGETGTGVGWVGEGSSRHMRSITVTA